MLLIEQVANGLQLGVMLFLIASGLTLVFGVMGLINLAHGSLYMIGAYVGATVVNKTSSFVIGGICGVAAAACVGVAIELLVLRRLYERSFLDQVLATYGLILFFNQGTIMLWGRQPIYTDIPSALSATAELFPGFSYQVYRLFIIAVGLLLAIGLYLLITKTRIGMLIRAGATHREMVRALGIKIRLLYTAVFGLGALLAGLAGFLAAPIFAIQVGMGEQILVLAFVVIIIGGIGSIRGALAGAMLVGMIDTLTRAFAPDMLRSMMEADQASALGSAFSSIVVYLLMAAVLVWRPRGLFPAAQ
jgi:branched-chain amino acid transport system permease protein